MIYEFKHPHNWLSNFYPVEIKIDDKVFSSVEHAYMSFKSEDPDWIKTCMDDKITSGKIKRLSREIDLVDGWDEMKLCVMELCLTKKFENRMLRCFLLATGDQNIQEGNTWGDKFWGVDLRVSPNIGENHLGRLIMKIRDQIRNEKVY